MIQMRVEPGAKAGNLRRAASLIGDAARNGADIAVLPEAVTLGWTDARSAELADEIPEGETCELLRDLAGRHKVFICAGVVELAGPRVYNAAVLMGPDQHVFLHHRKIYELDIAHDCYALGDRLAVADTPLGRIGVMICADAFAPGQVISRTLGLMGADLILSPCAWAVPAGHDNVKEPYGQLWRDNYGPVARDFRMWIAGVSNVGPIHGGAWAGRKCIGCSLLVGPDGSQVLQGPYGIDAETILYADINLEPRPARGDQWDRVWSTSTTPRCSVIRRSQS
jgi:predicted amidohydrolase